MAEIARAHALSYPAARVQKMEEFQQAAWGARARMSVIRQEGEDCLLRIWAKARSSRSRIVHVGEEQVEVQLAAPPVDGAANQELLRFLSKALLLPKSRLRLEKGETSRHKVVRVLALSEEDLLQRLAPPAG